MKYKILARKFGAEPYFIDLTDDVYEKVLEIEKTIGDVVKLRYFFMYDRFVSNNVCIHQKTLKLSQYDYFDEVDMTSKLVLQYAARSVLYFVQENMQFIVFQSSILKNTFRDSTLYLKRSNHWRHFHFHDTRLPQFRISIDLLKKLQIYLASRINSPYSKQVEKAVDPLSTKNQTRGAFKHANKIKLGAMRKRGSYSNINNSGIYDEKEIKTILKTLDDWKIWNEKMQKIDTLLCQVDQIISHNDGKNIFSIIELGLGDDINLIPNELKNLISQYCNSLPLLLDWKV